MTVLTNERPRANELTALYGSVGWSAYTRDPVMLQASIDGSHLVTTARDDHGRLIALARTISDGASICYLQDILVDPSAQRTGVGRSLLDHVLAHYADLRQFVLLTDDEPAQRALYSAAGLVSSVSRELQAYLRA